MVTNESRIIAGGQLGIYNFADGIPVFQVNESVVREKKEEIRMDQPWSAFGQLIFVHEMEGPTGGKIKKIAAVSMSYPAGVRSRMGEAIMRQTLQPESPYIYEWGGVQEGKLQAIVKELDSPDFEFGLLDKFVDISETVISSSHEFPDHAYVQEFLRLQLYRRRFLPELKKDIKDVLYTPSFLRKSAFEEKFKGKGLYRLEMYMDESGELFAITPSGEVRPVIQIAADQPHASWLLWLRQEISKPGNRIIGHVDDTETVSGCGGSKGCSDFFTQMEGTQTIFSTTAWTDMSIRQTIAASYSGEEQKCSDCNKAIENCNCKENQ